MAQTKKTEENIQTQENNQPQLESNEQTQTPPSRQAGANQPQDSPSDYNLPQANYGQSQAMTRGGGRGQRRGLSRREQYEGSFSFMRRFSEEIIWGCYEKRRPKYDSGKSRYVKRHG